MYNCICIYMYYMYYMYYTITELKTQFETMFQRFSFSSFITTSIVFPLQSPPSKFLNIILYNSR